MSRFPFRAWGALSLVLTSACGDGLGDPTWITHARVVGTIVSVEGDPSRSTPASGESFEVAVVVAEPVARGAWEYDYVVGVPEPGTNDLPTCGAILVDEAGVLTAPPTMQLAFRVDVPSEAELSGASELVVIGAACAGELTTGLALADLRDETREACADGSANGDRFVVRVALAPGSQNTRPELASATIDGSPWPEDDEATRARAAGTPCVDLDPVLTVARDSLVTMGFSLRPEDREDYLASDGSPHVERPYVASFATDGDFEGAFAVFDGVPSAGTEVPGEHDTSDVGVTYRTTRRSRESPLADDGSLTRFTFVVRDGRGGASAYVRHLCLVP